MDVLRRAMENEFGAQGFKARGLGVTAYDVPARPLFEPAKRSILSDRNYHSLILDSFRRACKEAIRKL
jgi:hypothetical protein